MIEDVGVEPDAALPGDRRRLRVDADLFELAHVAPQLEGADLEEIAEEHAALEAVLNAATAGSPLPPCTRSLGASRSSALARFHPPSSPNSARRRSDTR